MTQRLASHVGSAELWGASISLSTLSRLFRQHSPETRGRRPGARSRSSPPSRNSSTAFPPARSTRPSLAWRRPASTGLAGMRGPSRRRPSCLPLGGQQKFWFGGKPLPAIRSVSGGRYERGRWRQTPFRLCLPSSHLLPQRSPGDQGPPGLKHHEHLTHRGSLSDWGNWEADSTDQDGPSTSMAWKAAAPARRAS
jgi:hypothetical protein